MGSSTFTMRSGKAARVAFSTAARLGRGKRPTQDQLVSFCKQRGFVFAGSEIYGGLANSFDYGPLGAQLKKNIRDCWWRDFVERRTDCVGFESAIISNRAVWDTAGHVENFTDPLTECRSCHARVRADTLLESHGHHVTDGSSMDFLSQAVAADTKVVCPSCGKHDFAPCREFNLLFSTSMGPTSETSAQVFLRPETAQGIFVGAHKTANALRKRLPFGVGQVGKAFRNEISPGNFTFRMREFEQCELEFFCEPAEAERWFGEWQTVCHDWLLRYGVAEDSLRMIEHNKEDLAHYAAQGVDIEFEFAHGWGELWGVANRTDFDLRLHSEATNTDMRMLCAEGADKKVLPYTIEPSVGLDRLVLAFLTDSLQLEAPTDGKATRTVLSLHPSLAPTSFAILPLVKKDEHVAYAKDLQQTLSQFACTDLDLTASIGKRYRRQDEIGTPFCVTVDYDTLSDNTVTIRDRDSMAQTRVSVEALVEKARNFRPW